MRASAKTRVRVVAVLVSTLLLAPSSALGFAEWSSGDTVAEARGSFRWSALSTKGLHDDSSSDLFAGAGFLRLIGDLGVGEWLRFELHGLEFVSGFTEALTFGTGQFAGGERNRTRALRWQQRDDEFSQAVLEIDRASVRMTLGRLDLTVGRQPISLATSSMFTPNDFFAPFAAQTFYRVYKPGVDAARADFEIDELAWASIIGVLGYRGGGSSDGFDPVRLDESSLVGRAVVGLWLFEFSLLGGSVAGRAVLGGGLQGELFEWLGIRGEGHVSFEDDATVELSLGVEHRFENTLFLRAEQLYHGGGGADPASYLGVALSRRFSELPYLSRHYTAFGAGYEISPLLNGDALVLVNWADPSVLITVYLLYSLLDEAELGVTASLPLGEGPSGATMASEFGLYPASFSAEFRYYQQ
jgi:hypothetical protein